ncbi:MAG TPA: Hsp20/alpha crystallin family protein [Candidatus Dormibacteraeota bacterium]|jgi:HSP20 family protein|nr:Hsp20/alpha crystallin family protein [Candidatus Dormibacteraeota bacterium]
MVIWWRPPLQAGSFEEELGSAEAGWRPDLDIFESDDEFLLAFDLPGVTSEDVEVILQGRTLAVAGVRRAQVPPEAIAHLVERPRGSFERRVRLPASADLSRLRTELRDGQLLVVVGKRRSAGVEVRIAVERG